MGACAFRGSASQPLWPNWPPPSFAHIYSHIANAWDSTPPIPPIYSGGFGGGRYTQFRLEKKESLLGCLPLSSPSPPLVLSPARGFLEELRTEGVLHTACGSAPGIQIQKIYFHTLAGSEAGIVVGHHKPTELRGAKLGHLTSYERTSSRPWGWQRVWLHHPHSGGTLTGFGLWGYVTETISITALLLDRSGQSGWVV
jgi:hypothetical protein